MKFCLPGQPAHQTCDNEHAAQRHQIDNNSFPVRLQLTFVSATISQIQDSKQHCQPQRCCKVTHTQTHALTELIYLRFGFCQSGQTYSSSSASPAVIECLVRKQASSFCIEHFQHCPCVPSNTNLLLLISRAMSHCVEQYQEAEHDPTLASCCQRDLAQQAQDWKCLQRLQAADRSTVRTDMTTAVLATPSVSAQQTPSHASSEFPSDTEAGDT